MKQPLAKQALQENEYFSKPILDDMLATERNGWSQVLLADCTEDAAVAQVNWQVSTYEIAPATLTPPPLPIDWNRLHQISDHDPEFELELLHLFAEDTKQHLKQLELAIATQDFSALEQHAHHIKGASGNVGLNRMQTAASALEIQARNYHFDQPIQQFVILQQTLEALQTFLAVR